MRKTITQLFGTLLVTTALLGSASAADKKGAPKDPGLNGSITAVDKAAKTITIAGKTVLIDDTTAITENGKAATLDDVKAGKQAHVATVNLSDKLTAVSIKLGQLPPAATAPKKKK